MKKAAIWAAILILLAAVAGAAVASLWAPYQGFRGETFVELDRGAGTLALGRALQRAGVIRYAWQFWLERAFRSSAKLTAGEYRFAGPASVHAIFDRIARGDIFYIELRVPEGSNMFDVAKLVEASGRISADEFLRAASDPTPIRDIDPQARTLEGYLFPATYRLSHLTTAGELCRMMTAQFRKQWKRLGGGAPHFVVTLASMVEKETGIAQERPLVAGVFTNRLTRGMHLECDPTTIYAALLEERYRGAIHRSDLDSDNPYNTYRNPGLPPGPIANPGAEALEAALHPATTKYLYFVAKRSGEGHWFSSTLADHEKAVQAYRHDPQEYKVSQRHKAPKRKAEAARKGL
ncbi:MAG TPA: endolytic transglycosylase MltG [Bryobacteraceae bacterium]|nr:endolytic transglycosylase MltG [Bryobacteraceae bacterium]